MYFATVDFLYDLVRDDAFNRCRDWQTARTTRQFDRKRLPGGVEKVSSPRGIRTWRAATAA